MHSERLWFLAKIFALRKKHCVKDILVLVMTAASQKMPAPTLLPTGNLIKKEEAFLPFSSLPQTSWKFSCENHKRKLQKSFSRFDDFVYFYHRYDLPKLNYTVCTDEDMNKLHRAFLPESFWDGHSQEDLDMLHHILKKEIWQVG